MATVAQRSLAYDSMRSVPSAFGRGARFRDVAATAGESRQEPELAVPRKGFALVLTADEIMNQLPGVPVVIAAKTTDMDDLQGSGLAR